MQFRITPQYQMARQSSYIRQGSNALATLQQQASSGLRLLKPSDDPVAQNEVMRAKGDDERMGSNQRSVAGVRAKLDQANANLLDANKLFTRARAVALEGANDGTDRAAFETLAGEVDNLLGQLMTFANGQSDGRSLFAGTATGQPPFAVTATDASGRPATISYQGSSSRASVTVGQGRQVDMLYSGEEIFQKPGQDAFAALIGLRDLLRNTGGLPEGQQRLALSQQVGTLEQAQNGILEATGQLSVGQQSLDALDLQLGDRRVQTKTRIGELESADLASVVVDLRAQETLLSNSLQLTSRIYDLNLLNMLR